jgi:hypothetical protein
MVGYSGGCAASEEEWLIGKADQALSNVSAPLHQRAKRFSDCSLAT